jgi:AraC family transcriptional regulator of arabinose operon
VEARSSPVEWSQRRLRGAIDGLAAFIHNSLIERREETPYYDVDVILTGHERARVDTCWRPRGCDEWVLMHTLGGRGRFGLPAGDRVIGPGETILQRPGTPQDHGSLEPWHLVWVHFQPRPEWHKLLVWRELAPGTLWMGPPASPLRKRIEALLVEVHQLASGALPHADMLALNALEAAFIWWDIQNPERRSLDPRIAAVIEHVGRELEGPITIAQLAQVAHLSTSHFSYLFHEQVGLTPRAFVEQQRLERAKQLLEVTTLPIRAVGQQVGFASQFHFATRFRKRLGMSPSGYRRTVRDMNGSGYGRRR